MRLIDWYYQAVASQCSQVSAKRMIQQFLHLSRASTLFDKKHGVVDCAACPHFQTSYSAKGMKAGPVYVQLHLHGLPHHPEHNHVKNL